MPRSITRRAASAENPKPQSEYGAKLKNPKWQRKRLEIMARDGFRCIKCSDEETTIHVHHLVYLDGLEPWEYPDCLLVSLCKNCHDLTHETFWKSKDGVIWASATPLEDVSIRVALANPDRSKEILEVARWILRPFVVQAIRAIVDSGHASAVQVEKAPEVDLLLSKIRPRAVRARASHLTEAMKSAALAECPGLVEAIWEAKRALLRDAMESGDR